MEVDWYHNGKEHVSDRLNLPNIERGSQLCEKGVGLKFILSLRESEEIFSNKRQVLKPISDGLDLQNPQTTLHQKQK